MRLVIVSAAIGGVEPGCMLACLFVCMLVDGLFLSLPACTRLACTHGEEAGCNTGSYSSCLLFNHVNGRLYARC
jgi:hypothetical protein